MLRILIEIHHPKQAHLFRPLIRRWQERGDKVQIVTRDKDITVRLLDLFGLSYACLSRQQSGWRSGLELIWRWLLFAVWILRFRPDVALSVSGITTSLPSRLLGVPNIILTDTDTARISNRIAFPFATRVVTPSWFNRPAGPHHYVYRGFHEWSYLHPSEFRPDPGVVAAEGIDPAEPYAVVRLVAWHAVHDWGEAGFGPADLTMLIEQLSRRMRIYLSCEGHPPRGLEQFVAKVRPDRMHHVMAFARLIVSEGTSMAAEAALMGVPALVVSSLADRIGYMQVLERDYGLVRVFRPGPKAIQEILAVADNLPSPVEVRARRDKLVEGLAYMPDVIEKHIDAVMGKSNG